jgi:hypothetical protein
MSAEAPPLVKTRGAISRAAREPLVQFLVAGVVLFAANGLLNGEEQQRPQDEIAVTEGRVEQIAESYRLLSGRPPSRAELEALVDDFILEEIYYREAVAMGLDADDTIVRRRMRQKLEFLAEDAEASKEPSEEELAAWLASHKQDYRLPARISFRQILASRDRRGAKATSDAAEFLKALKAGADPENLGDASMLPSALPLTTQKGVAALFGEAFASTLFEHKGEGWFGPVASPLGAHNIFILSQEPARDPALDDVRGKLRADWIEARRRKTREDFRARLRQRYEVSIDWPGVYQDQPAPAGAMSAD